MPDTVTSQVVRDDQNGYYAVHLTNASDGTGESNVNKIDVSTLTAGNGSAATYTTIKRIVGNVWGMNYVRLHWDATTDTTIAILKDSFDFDWSMEGGITDPRGTGTTGDVLLTTNGATSGGGYDITIYTKLKN